MTGAIPLGTFCACPSDW